MSVKTVGVIGSGQLGRMMAIAGAPLDVEFVFFDEALSSPSSSFGPTIQPSSKDALASFLDKVDVVTYESENTDAELVEKIATSTPVYPSVKSLRFSQHRLTEKTLFNELGIQTAKFERVASEADLDQAIETLGLPLILKTTTMGYDGKGQALVKTLDDAKTAWNSLKGNELIAESFVTFSRELSIIAVRSTNGDIKIYPLAENDHSNGILRVSRVPAQDVSTEKQEQAERFISTLLSELDHIGVLTLELFDTETGLVANEMAPRVHNSGHWSIEGAYSSQFDNHVRAITGMPLGDTSTAHPHCAMVNIIGKFGDRDLVLSTKGAYLHMYNKTERQNRNIGHINIIAESEGEREQLIQKFEAFIKECG